MLSNATLKDLKNESSCSHSTDKTTKTCDKPKPGATTGGCAFEGAQISLFPFADCAHIVHSPATCLNASWETRQTRTSWEGTDFTQMGFCTDIGPNELIFGGEKKLKAGIDYVMQNYAPKGIFVYSTCVTALTGEDIDSVCKAKEAEYGIPVVPVHAAGFLGNKNFGSRLGGEAVLESLIGRKEPPTTTPYDINLIGEYNVTGDMWQYKPLLEKLGIRVLSTLSGDGRIESIQYAHRAKLNVIVCAKSLVTFTRKMNEKYGIPFISVSFYGKNDTSHALRTIAEAFGDATLIAKTEALIVEEEAKLEAKLAFFKKAFECKKCILNTGGNKSWSIASALQDIGLKVVATAVNKATPDDIDNAKERLGESVVLMKVPSAEQAPLIKEHGVDILLAGGRSLYTALKNKISFVDVNQEKKISYGGYDGLVNLAQDVYDALSNPVFKIASKAAPWEK
jgi:nitrogenase molybdenum-cofactor synthesis protein NifE